GDFGLASGERPGGGFSRLWFQEAISPDEVVFDGQTYLLLPSTAKALRTAPPAGPDGRPAAAAAGAAAPVESEAAVATASPVTETAGTRRIRLSGSIP